MAKSKNRLGRGLGGLISGGGADIKGDKSKGDNNPSLKNSNKKSKITTTTHSENDSPKIEESNVNTENKESTINDFSYISLDAIKANPYQPRREILDKDVEELAKSIESEGLLQPIVLRSTKEGFELIAGERRLRAFKLLKRDVIPSRVIEASDASSATLALIENLQREDLNPIDEALGYLSLVRDFDLTQEAAADRVGKGRTTVANALRLLSLSDEIKGFLSRRLLSTGHAKVLLGIKDNNIRSIIARKIIEKNLSVREAEKLIKITNNKGFGTNKTENDHDNAENTAIEDLQRRIEKHFNTNVSIKHGKKKGKLIIEYFGNEDLDRLLELLGINHY